MDVAGWEWDLFWASRNCWVRTDWLRAVIRPVPHRRYGMNMRIRIPATSTTRPTVTRIVVNDTLGC